MQTERGPLQIVLAGMASLALALCGTVPTIAHAEMAASGPVAAPVAALTQHPDAAAIAADDGAEADVSADTGDVAAQDGTALPSTSTGAERFVASHHRTYLAAVHHAIARFGPFVVLDSGRAALVGPTDSRTPARFAKMIEAFPTIHVIELVECPGTVDDSANLRLGRMIRARDIETDVPSGGSVRSGAVELFLAGKARHAAPDAIFAVHAWEDDLGRQPRDFPMTAPVNRAYLDYYRSMGMSAREAVDFYALTNSVPNRDVLWLTTWDIARYARID